MRVLLVTEGYADKNEILKLNTAAHLMEDVVNSSEFKEWVLDFSYKANIQVGGIWPFRKYETRMYHGFRMNRNLTQLEIYNHIMSGKEVGTQADNEANIYVKIDRSVHPGVLGYTYPNSRIQYIYAKFMRNGSVADISGNLIHEYVHRLGYDHESKPTPLRPYTVPYAVGYYVMNVIRKKVKSI